MRIIGVIPARFESSRFPGKPLADIGGKSMIQRVYEQCKKASVLNAVVVATDNDKIESHVKSFGGEVVMTGDHHQSGTDRVMEAVENYDGEFDVVINIQGDEPFIDPKQIELVAGLFADEKVSIGTLVKKIEDEETLFNTNTPKVVVDRNGDALYFSRQTVPHMRNLPPAEWLVNHTYFKHIGIYAFRPSTLKEITSLPVSALEKAEALEQLRWLEQGYKIRTALTSFESLGIDTPSDLEKVKKLL